MDLKQTGKYIQERRKLKNLTQVELATKLNVSEKTISKWECGKGFPDTSLILPLCKELDITANELLSGQTLSSEKAYKTSAEQNLIELKAQQTNLTKHLLNVEIVLVALAVIIIISCSSIISFVKLQTVWKVLIMAFGFILAIVCCVFSMVIETKAGFYECPHCHHRYIPTYKQSVFAMHMGRTKYLKCPHCNRHGWNKKKIDNN